MEDLQDKIIELMDLFDDEQVTTADKIDRPERALEKQAIDDFMKRNPMAGGGMLVQPSADGSRSGYKDERRVLGDPITIDGKQYKKVIEGPDQGKYVIREGQNNPRQFVNKSEIKKTVKANMEKGKQNLKEMYAQRNVLNQRTLANKNKWIKNWLNKNLNKYNVREFNNFQNDLLNNFNAEVKKNPKKYGTSRKDFSLIKDNFPIYGDPQIGGEIYDGVTFTRAGADRNQLLSYQKIFFKNKLKDKDFKAKVNSYLDWNLTRKVEGGAGSMTKTTALDYGKFKKGFDDDVIYLMGEVLNNRALNPGGGQIGINDIFKKSIGKKADAYFKKYQGSWTRWLNNFYEVASLAGLDKSQADALIQKQKNDSQKIMRLFNVEKLPPEFVVAQDHLFGLSEAKALGDPKIARQTLQALIATTKEQNRILGQEGFSGKRTALIKRFKNASLENKANIVNELNTLAEEYVPGRLQYNVKKDGSLKITNLQPEKTLKARTEAYKKITETFPKKIQNLSDGPSFGSLDVGSMFRKLSPGAKKVVGFGGGTILPEVLFYQLDKANRMSKGVTEKEAAAGALESGTLGAYTDKAYMEELKKVADTMGIDSGAFDSAYQLNILSKSFEQNSRNVDAQIATALENQDLKTAEELRKNFNKYVARIKPEAEKLRNDIEERVTGGSPLTMAMGRGNVTDEQYSKPFYDMQDVAMEKLKKEKQKAFDTQKRQVDTAAGSIGEGFYQAFDSLTQGAKNLLKGRIIPFGPDKLRPLESDREREARYLKEMDPRELFLYNKARGYTYDDPITEADLMNLQMEQPGLFFAKGGRAGLSGGDRSGAMLESMNPDSQGLQGLFNRVKKV